ncbi:restriction endonuclease subunit S [Saccharopolyspora erythraea]|uniref:restriction endonuclease subunit S n=1 Tax=Saccharopolyspora erythraea TaxID=1836 RepID=UPI001BA949A3|nr:restriction endonuclease subunit S [Saccharopolyspora erythraea]QUH05011.1 restriction endonuclease subunit S [Saccharopolyspora erythraea]
MKSDRWKSVPIRRLGELVGGGTPVAKAEYWDGEVPFATPPDLRPVIGGVVHATQRTVTAEGAAAGSSTVPAGSVLLSIRAPIGYVARTATVMSFSQGCRAIVPFKGTEASYLTYALVAAGAELTSLGRGTTFMEVSAAQLAALEVPVPPQDEQRAIADYLDRETARIDTLIEEQQRLIEMLGERRDAVIAEAATKGVRAGVALVESGVEWIGAIPERWSVKALRRCGTLLTGSTPPTNDRGNFAEEANERPWVRPQDLSSATTASAWLTPQGWSHLRPVPAGSVLVGCIAYSLGSVGYLPVPATTNQQITSVVPTEVDGRYLYYVLHATKSELWAASQMNRVPILNNQRLGAIQIPVPPVDEQRLIAEYLDEQTAKIDRTKAESERLVELARERRAALITAVVTGQIDVRERV